MTTGTGLTRFDRNVAANIFDFAMYDQDQELIKALALFFSHDLQYRVNEENLFGRKILDPLMFSKISERDSYISMINKIKEVDRIAQFKEPRFKNYSKEELKALLKKGKMDDGEPLFVSRLDNALYRCMYESMRFSKSGKTPNGFDTSELKEIKFLKSLKKFHHPRTNKIYYEYELSDTFINDLARFFLKLDYKIYNKIPRAYQNLYISLINLRDRHNKENQPNLRLTWEFDKFCDIAQTYCTKPRENKRYINNAIAAIQNVHEGSQFIQVDWTGPGKHKYTPVLNFSWSEREILEKQTESKNRFQQFTLMNLKAKFRENFTMITDEVFWKSEFIRWMRDPNWHFDLKHSVVLNTYMQCFGKKPTNKVTGEEDPYDKHIMEFIKETIPQMADQPIF